MRSSHATPFPRRRETTTMTDITSIQDRFRDKAAETRGNLSEMGHLAKEAVQEKLHDLKDGAAEKFASGKEKLHDMEASLLHAVRGAPVKSLLIALGVGVTLSFLWRRR